MGRGKHFNHKEKGHENEIPERGKEVASKYSLKEEYAIEPVASQGDRPVTIKVDKE
ncbi:hypothetical protein [Bacillus sp. HMF5848]|uniref:hypothetical protein n=1 Tax=Bacillus sp. HMF5848 TaxID=2495421 RepID=UPI00163AAB37|nr:hypothetical protein [Bacillus sp. HMF5848]